MSNRCLPWPVLEPAEDLCASYYSCQLLDVTNDRSIHQQTRYIVSKREYAKC
jgi:hypothetical protein